MWTGLPFLGSALTRLPLIIKIFLCQPISDLKKHHQKAAILGSRIAFDATMKQVNLAVESILKYTDETEFTRIQRDLLFSILKLNVVTTPKHNYSSMWKGKIKFTTFSFD